MRGSIIFSTCNDEAEDKWNNSKLTKNENGGEEDEKWT
jgi:hypothetical protein